MKTQLPDQHRATEFLAAERTFLAWVRTSIAVVSLGFVVAKFGVWFRELAGGIGAKPSVRHPDAGMSMPVGITMIVAGALVCILAAWRYHVINRKIERGEVEPDRWLVILITVIISAMAVAMIAYVLSRAVM